MDHLDHQSVHRMFEAVAGGKGDETAYRFKKGGSWHDVSWRTARETVRKVSRALMALGVERDTKVGILSQTRLEWVLADFGAVSCGAVTVGVYPSNLPPDCAFVLNHSEAQVVFVENREQLDKLLSVRGEIPAVRHIVVFDGPGDPGHGVASWEEFLAKSSEVDVERFEQRAASIGPDDLASLVYTSGTTGVPKGAMITNGNLVFASWSAGECLATRGGFVTLLFLPLAHVFARLIVYACMRLGVTVAFAEDLQKVPENLREIQPHFIASVPRIFEKVYDRITTGVKEAGGIKEKLFNWALGVGQQVSRLRQQNRPVPMMLGLRYSLANKLVFHKIQAALGGRLEWAVSGAAPLNQSIAEFFHACGITILEGLGMTENTSFSNVNQVARNKFGTVGPAGPGIEMKLAEDGEVLFRGANVMKGYYRQTDATAETIDPDGWLHTGDIGEIDADGFLKITDRKKDLIITAGGKNVAPQRIERILRTSPYLSQVVAIGDKRKFISALVTLDPEHMQKWCGDHGVKFDNMEALASDPDVNSLILGEIESRNRELASFESVKKFRIVPRDFSIEEGELTPTLKIKRKVVMQRYGGLIDQMYESA